MGDDSKVETEWTKSQAAEISKSSDKNPQGNVQHTVIFKSCRGYEK
uniref:DUF3606 domain-containing protein n=1 Tax=Heterorhabditis bacteriophora TaxID=37862 RepID=A0A1I7W8L4_HETBA